MSPLFSILTVSLNPGEKLLETLESVRSQDCDDYEIIIKDGGSKDGSLEQLREYLEQYPEFAARVRLVETPDKSIYDGMNQAISHGMGAFFYFLNCGDTLYGNQVLSQVAKELRSAQAAGDVEQTGIYYGNQYDVQQQAVDVSNPKIDAFACYRNVPCHQACFYARELFSERGYEPQYKVRGDYEHFLWCFFEKQISPKYLPITIANYEGGGFSETPANRKRSAAEHKEITALYMTRAQRFCYRMMMCLTLAPLRTKLAESPTFSGLYHKLRGFLYRK